MAVSTKTSKIISAANVAYKKVTSQALHNSNLKDIQITSFSDDLTSMTAELKLARQHLNKNGTLHGGCATTIIDELTFVNLAFYRGIETVAATSSHSGAASVKIDVNFMSPAREGDVIEINSRLVKVGKRLVFVSAEILNKSKNNQIVASGQQVISIDPKSLANTDEISKAKL